MSKEVAIGIVGSMFAADFHARVWETIPGAKIVAVSGRTESKRKDFQKRFAVETGYADYRDLLADGKVDLVDICLPNYVHAEVSLAAMNAGKDVMCEKPVATSLGDAERIVQTQKETGKMFFYAEDWIFAPALVRAAAVFREGAIGDPLYLKGKETHNGSHSPFAQTIEYCGGGAMIHLGCHPVGFFYHLLGKPQQVIGSCSDGGSANMVHKSLEGEDWGVGILEYANGVRAVVEGNYITRGGMDDVVEIYGTEGVIKVNLTLGSPISVYSGPGYGYAVEKAETTTGWTSPAVDEYASLGYRNELAHVMSCLVGGETQAKGTTAEDARNILEIVHAIYRSHREKRTVELGE